MLALGPATIMMGATFPALVRHLSRSAELGDAFGRLYSANTAGAVAGTLVAGLVLIELFGLGGALAVGASGSAIAGIVALFLAREPASPTSDASVPPSVDAAALRRLPVATTMRLPLVVAFVSGLTSLGYQVTWTRLLSSGTGGFTYVFTAVLALFLIGIAVGAFLYSGFRLRITNPVRVLVWTQLAVAVLAVVGLVAVIGQPRPLDPTDPVGSIGLLVISAVLVVLPVTIVLGIAFPTASALLPDEASRAGTESGSLLAVNTAGAIIGSLVIPFVLMPIIGSPSIVILLALTNALLGLGLALVDRPRRLPVAGIAALTAVFVIAIATRPGAVAQPNVALIAARGGQLFASDEDEIASVQAGQISFTPELWVAGTSMTLLTVDAKLMTILPLIARPASERALVVAFGMGTSFRSALVAGLRTDVVELVPSVPEMFRHYYPDAARVLADPAGRVVIADGRNHLELSTERFDIIVTDPPPPIESSGAAVISSLEYYEAGREHLTPGGVMMQWIPYGSPEEEFKEHIRTFASGVPVGDRAASPGGYGIYMLGSDDPIDLDPDTARAILARPGVLDDLSEAFDSPARFHRGLDRRHRRAHLAHDRPAARVRG